ncbi:hypothetical protein L2D00_01825 [Hyphomonadaceae bacterium BL14]|nr:hypothetical protein L2D00_01825 [Hyphomonadaceae bacterium BL14]
MVSRPLTCLLAAASLGAAAPAQAQLRDVLLVERDGGPHLWLAFDRQPASAFIEAGALYITGVDGEAARRITPAGPAPIAALHLAPEPDGVRLTLDGAPMQTAEIRAGGVWLTLDAHGWTAPPAARVAAARPAPGAAQSPEPSPAPSSVPPPEPAPTSAGPAMTPRAAPEPAQTSQPGPASTPAQRAAALNPACAGIALELEDAPWDLDLIAAQGACLARAGDSAEAAVQFERVLAFEPEHARAALGLARLKEAAGELGAAADLYDIAARGARTDGEALEAMAAARRLREASGE